MKKTIWALLALFIFASCKKNINETTTVEITWDTMAEILDQIKAPVFPDNTFLITDHGAVADSTVDCLPAIMNAITQCNESGGGKVVIPEGTWLVNGPIHLKSNVNLFISENATVKFSTDPTDYLPLVFTRWEGMELMNYSPLIYAFEQENIAITGTGTLNGMASNENWWPWCGKDSYGHQTGQPSQADEGSRPRLLKYNELETPVAERVFGEGSFLRPNFIQPYKCKNVLIEGVTIRNSPMWIIHPVLCENVTIEAVRVISHGPNSDGCDPEASKNVLIKDCYFDTGDDCIALKSGRNQDGRRIGRPVENIVIQNCIMKDGHGGVVIGSEVSGGARNIFAENCQMDSPNLDRALRIKTNKTRGGTIENLFFRNIAVGEVKEAVFKVNMHYPIYSNPDQDFIPVIKNIFIEDVNSSKSKYAILINGYDDEHPVTKVHLKNCHFDGVQQGNSIQFCTELNLEEVYVNGDLQD